MRNPFWPAVFPAVSEHLAGKTGCSSAAIVDMIVAENRRRMSGNGDAARAMDWDDIVQTVAARLGVACDLSVEQLVLDHSLPPTTAILDEADRALADVAAQGWQIVVATHGLSRYQLPVLRALNLLPFFADLATPDTRGCFKQSRAFWLPYLDACRPLVHCGDLYSDDVLPARSFGIGSVWKTTPAESLAGVADPFQRARLIALPAGNHVRPDAVIFHLNELPGVLERMGHG